MTYAISVPGHSAGKAALCLAPQGHDFRAVIADGTGGRHPLIDIAGPEGAPDLLRHLCADLGTVRAERLIHPARKPKAARPPRVGRSLAKRGPKALCLPDDLIPLIARQSPPEACP